MATLITRYIDPHSTGGDGTTRNLSGPNAAFKSLRDWELNRRGNIVVRNTIEEAVCCGSSTGSIDSVEFTISGSNWATDTICRIIIRGELQLTGQIINLPYYFSPVITVNGNVFITFKNLLFSVDHTSIDRDFCLSIFKAHVNITGCWFLNTDPSAHFGYFIKKNNDFTTITNCVFDDSFRLRSGVQANSGFLYSVNNTFINLLYGIQVMSGNTSPTIAINNILYGCSFIGNFYVNSLTNPIEQSDYNITNLSTIGYVVKDLMNVNYTPQNDIINGAISFLGGGYNAIPVDVSGSVNSGKTNPLSGSTYYVSMNNDINNNIRLGVWDRGAVENINPPSPPVITSSLVHGKPFISWSAVPLTITYNVYWSTSPFTLGSEVGVTKVANVIGYNYTLDSVTTGFTYYFMVDAVNSYGSSLVSNIENQSIVEALPTAPELNNPTLVDGEIRITWVPNASDSYNLYWSNDNDITKSSEKFVNVTTPLMTGIIYPNTYYFKITGVVGGVESGLSNLVYESIADKYPIIRLTLEDQILMARWDAFPSASSYTLKYSDGGSDTIVTDITDLFYVIPQSVGDNITYSVSIIVVIDGVPNIESPHIHINIEKIPITTETLPSNYVEQKIEWEGTPMPVLSGITPDLDKQLFFEMFSSGKVFMGFSRRDPIWGLSSLVKVKQTQTFPSNVMASFTDTNNVGGGSRSTVYIKQIDKTQDVYNVALGNILDAGVVGTLELEYMGSDWCRITGFNPAWVPSDIDLYDYYILSSSTEPFVATKIEHAVLTSSPILYTDCYLAWGADGSTYPSIVFNGEGVNLDAGALERKINLNGELIITGLISTFTLSTEQKAGVFYIVDTTGRILHDKMAFNTVINEPTELGIAFICSQGSTPFTVKIVTEENATNKLALFNESLPFASWSAPVSDANPPALSLAYSKNPAISRSIFDVLGMSRVAPSTEVFFVKKIERKSDVDIRTLYPDTDDKTYIFSLLDPKSLVVNKDNYPIGTYNRGVVRENITVTSSAYHNILLSDGHDFIIGDTITVGGIEMTVKGVDYRVSSSGIWVSSLGDVSLTSGQEILSNNLTSDFTIEYASTNSSGTAVGVGCDSVMIQKGLPNTGALSPTADIYRQLFVCYKPLDTSGSEIDVDTYQQSNFNSTTYVYDIGKLLYLSNKTPVYRQYLSEISTGINEMFTIII